MPKTKGIDSNAPNWVYFIVALSIEAYQILDNLDGKQARRTGSSTPLGEIFDHGNTIVEKEILCSNAFRSPFSL